MQYDTIQQTAAYTGLKQSCFVSTVNVVRTDNGKTVDSQVKPEVFYRQDGKNVVPVQPGSYDVWFKVDGNQYDVIEEKLVYGEADTVVSGLKRGGSYQFKAVYEPDDKDGQTYYETVTSEAVTVTIKEDSSTGGSGTTGDKIEQKRNCVHSRDSNLKQWKDQSFKIKSQSQIADAGKDKTPEINIRGFCFT